MKQNVNYEKKLTEQISKVAGGRISNREAYASFVAFAAKKLNVASQLKIDTQRVENLNRTICSSGIEEEKFEMIFNTLVDALEDDMNQDLLGKVCEHLKLVNFRAGQFFTPYPVSKFMAELNMSEYTLAKQSEPQSIADPCCGTGVMLIAAANVIKEKGYPLKNYIMYAQDIDQTMALSCYVQLALQGVAGMVIVGDSLHTDKISHGLIDEGDAWVLPMTYHYYPEVLVDIKDKARKLEKKKSKEVLER